MQDGMLIGQHQLHNPTFEDDDYRTDSRTLNKWVELNWITCLVS